MRRWLSRHRHGIACAAAGALLGSLIVVGRAAETHRISQQNRAFSLSALTIARGDVIDFVNDDDFIHQIYIKSEDFNVDTAESAPGDTISVPFTESGTFEVHCHIHPKMALVVTVR